MKYFDLLTIFRRSSIISQARLRQRTRGPRHTRRRAPTMDVSTYDKAKKYRPGHGFEARSAAPSAIVVHSTSNPNHKNTAFTAEAKFLLDNALAGAHYLIGKDGAVVRFLEPRPWAAWHAGNARTEYSNQRSIGIELHHSVGDPPYPDAQIDALGTLLRSLMALFNIPLSRVETHGQIAIAGPYRRKTDPSDWSHAAFIVWRDQLLASEPVDLFKQWGPIGKPTGAAVGFAVPRAWLVNKTLGACVTPETYSLSGRYSVTEFEAGMITYLKTRNTTIVEMF